MAKVLVKIYKATPATINALKPYVRHVNAFIAPEAQLPT